MSPTGRFIYLDWNATAPPLPAALTAMSTADRVHWGNAASVHAMGRRSRASLEASRASVARALGGAGSDVTFTSGATEANNLALRSMCVPGSTLITSRLEHPSVVKVAEWAALNGVFVRWLQVTRGGEVDVDDLGRALQDAKTRVVVVALQAANHETGVIQPVEDAAGLCESRGALLHVDAVQAVGKTAEAAWKRADTFSVTAHKLRGPKGIGALVSNSCLQAPLTPLLLGGAQEGRLRPGTAPVSLAAGFAAAADWAIHGPSRYASICALRDRLEQALLELGGELNGTGRRLPHVVNVSFPNVVADELVAALDMEGVGVSAGSACSSGTVARSPVIECMLGSSRAQGAIRASLGDETTADDVDEAILVFRRVLTRAWRDG